MRHSFSKKLTTNESATDNAQLMARASQNATPEEQTKIKKAVAKKFPDIDGEKPANNSSRRNMTLNNFTTINSSQASATIRHDNLEGRPHLVVPMVMITEGVHAGSNGPLYYSPKELADTPQVWNHKPVVVNHPMMNGSSMSACEKTVIDKRKVGIILNTEFEQSTGRLKAEAWLDKEKLDRVDERIGQSVLNGKMMEVSTGLFTDNVSDPGEWNGENYDFVAKNFKPDHLAILPDDKGSCSIEDGAGLLRNSASESVGPPIVDPKIKRVLQAAIQKRTLPEDLEVDGTNMPPSIKGVYDTFCVFTRGDASQQWAQNFNIQDGSVKLLGDPFEVSGGMQYTTSDGKVLNHSKGVLKMNRKQIINKLITNLNTNWDSDDLPFLRKCDDVTLGKLAVNAGIMHKDGQDFADDGQNADGGENLRDAAAQVKPGGKGKGDDHTKAEGDDSDDDEEESDTMSKNSAQRRQPATNSAQKLTPQEFMAMLPKETQQFVANSVKLMKAEMSKLITKITANSANSFSKEELMSMNHDQLQKIARLAAQPEPKPVMNGFGGDFAGLGDAASSPFNGFAGISGYGDMTVNTGDGEQIALEIPTLNFSVEEEK